MTCRVLLPLLLVAAIAAGSAPGPRAQAPASGVAPRLLVIVVVDQLRSDYLTRYARFWKSGFKRLLAEGAIFTESAYPYLNTVTCVGHATIATGTFPYRHGVVLNEWWRRDEQRVRACTHDPDVTSVPYLGGMKEAGGHSARALQAPTLGDRLRAMDPRSRVVTLSMKPRSTVMLAGHGGTAVTWFGDADAWSTSTAYSSTTIPGVETILRTHDMMRDRKETWTRSLPDASYDGVDQAPWERPEKGWTSTFPHPLAGAPGTPEKQFYVLWEKSPYSDAFLGKAAADLVRAYKLGQRDAVDYLGVSFSATDYVGHQFGPDSHEIQDTLARLDGTLGVFLDRLDATVGRGNYALALTADHGVAPVPEHRVSLGLQAGRLPGSTIRAAAEKALAHLGPGPHVAHADYTELYLTDSTRALLAGRPGEMTALLGVLAQLDGALRAYPSASLITARGSTDPVARAAALSHFPGASGDIVVVPQPYWIQSATSGTTHGTLHPYDQRVPLIFMGGGVKPGHHADDASPADIVPTLAAVVGMPTAGVDGRILRAVLH